MHCDRRGLPSHLVHRGDDLGVLEIDFAIIPAGTGRSQVSSVKWNEVGRKNRTF